MDERLACPVTVFIEVLTYVLYILSVRTQKGELLLQLAIEKSVLTIRSVSEA